MKIGYIAKSNKKGQIVIPKEVRKALGITGESSLNMVLRDMGVYLYPVKEVLTANEKDNAYVQLLEKTQGTWNEDWDKLAKRRRSIELAASKKRKTW
ncbi:AbrB/MazE/SpoVT family DNA-binding domain-containing protein [Patescibacteria group bacterium]|nr:AbrB/MazE/SpoVT family DNA-binding domain-containing protein [Patescibacteria group bacterium]